MRGEKFIVGENLHELRRKAVTRGKSEGGELATPPIVSGCGVPPPFMIN